METTDLQSPDTVFASIAASFVPRSDHRLVCKQGFYDGCAVLKLQKPSWTNDSMDQVRNTSGIFFSIWTNKASLSKRRARYNVHALKMRELRGYSITSRDFASAFRRRFAPVQSEWPHVRVDFSPLTLMEGWMTIDPHRFSDDVHGLMSRFESLVPVIDDLLDARRR
jgi:hypothetical protein